MRKRNIMGAALLALALALNGYAEGVRGETGVPDQPYYQEGTAPAGAPGASVLLDMTGQGRARCFGITIHNDSATDVLLVTVGNEDRWGADPAAAPTVYESWLFNGAPFVGQPNDTTGIPPGELIPPIRVPPGEIAFLPTHVRFVAVATEAAGPIDFRVIGAF